MISKIGLLVFAAGHTEQKIPGANKSKSPRASQFLFILEPGPGHTGLIGSRSSQNYAFKGWLSLETMKLWLLALTKTHFLMTFDIKLTLGNIFTKVKNPPGGATITK